MKKKVFFLTIGFLSLALLIFIVWVGASILKNLGGEEEPPQTAFPPPSEIGFFKGVQLWPEQPKKSKEKIAQAQEMGATVVGIPIQSNYDDSRGGVILPDDWKRVPRDLIQEAYGKSLAVVLRINYPDGIDDKFPLPDPSTGLNDYNIPPDFDFGPLFESLKEVHRELAIFAEEHQVYAISFPAEIENAFGKVIDDYWEKSSQMAQAILQEIKKYYQGEVHAETMGGMFGVDTPCCYTNVPLEKIDYRGFDAIFLPTGSDYRIPGSPIGFVAEGLKRIEFIRQLGQRNNVSKIILGVGGYPQKDQRASSYHEFFEKSRALAEGYWVWLVDFLPVYDAEAIEAAKVWFKKF